MNLECNMFVYQMFEIQHLSV